MSALATEAREQAISPELALRARERPGMILFAYLARLSIASIVAFPIAAHVASFTGARATNDLALFEPGGLFLLEALRLGPPLASAEIQRALLALLLSAYLGLLPLAALLWSLSRRGRLNLVDLARASLRPLGTLSLLLGLAVLSYLLLASLAFSAVAILPANLGEPLRTIARAGIVLLALGNAAVLGVVHDLARAHAVRSESSALDSLRRGFASFGARPLIAWGWRFLAKVAIVGIAAWAAFHLGVASTKEIVAVAFVHQLAILGLVSLRASWLARALRFVG